MSGKSNTKWLETMIKKHGSYEAVQELQRELGRRGGKLSRNGGFASNTVGSDGLTGKERAKVAGVIGGQRSRLNRNKTVESKDEQD